MSEKNLVEAVFSAASTLGAPIFEALGRWLFIKPWACIKDVFIVIPTRLDDLNARLSRHGTGPQHLATRPRLTTQSIESTKIGHMMRPPNRRRFGN